MDGSKSQEQSPDIVGNNLQPVWSTRLVIVCFSAAAIGLPMAWVSLAKLLLFLTGLVCLVGHWLRNEEVHLFSLGLAVKVILGLIVFFALSLLWTSVNLEIALLALVKHAKLLLILLILLLVRTVNEARFALIAFCAIQSFVLLSSWLVFFGLNLPWVTNPYGKYVVFSTYLDQSIMMATIAAVYWHLRNEGIWPVWFGFMFACAALGNAIYLLDGKTGYVVALAVITLAIVWQVPKKHRFVSLLIAPLLVMATLYMGSARVQDRVSTAIAETHRFSQEIDGAGAASLYNNSSGWRINAWSRSVESIRESPWFGNGVGSWAVSVKTLEGANAQKIFGDGNASNPHQEYLLWGVELGVLGIFGLIAVFVALGWDSRNQPTEPKRATFSVIAALSVACLFNSVLYDDLIGDFFCILIGLLMAYGNKSLGDRENT